MASLILLGDQIEMNVLPAGFQLEFFGGVI